MRSHQERQFDLTGLLVFINYIHSLTLKQT